ncbi:MAG TPA: MerR family transcriptional regulator [Thermomicrobiales bacterium]|nr:MerR family transcriptional regulator [Thermomicrobiales bacterium]
MHTTSRATLSIGDLSRRTGVPVKTIRFYSDQGIVPPAEVTDAGYRRYAEDDVVRLETVRTLRAAGFDIATIREMLDRTLAPVEAMRLQVETLAVQERTLRRQRLMLERAIERGDVPGYPERGRALALLSAAERSAFLRHRIASGVEGVDVDASWWNGFMAAAVEGIPEEVDDDQLVAWTELADMIDDASFAEAIRRTAESFWERFVGNDGMSLDVWQERQQALIECVREAMRAGVEPGSRAGAAIIDDWRDSLGPAGDEILAHMIETHDPRLARYWKLIAIVKRLPYDRELDAAWTWILIAARRFTDR